MNKRIATKVRINRLYNNRYIKHNLSMLLILFGVIAITLSFDTTASDHMQAEAHCFDYVQDKIYWNYDHNARWEPENIKQLCKGTNQPKQPGDCFHAVMHGGSYGNDGIEWGEGSKWNWKNAVALCAGANDADKRIGCFKGHIAEEHKWAESIAACLKVDR